MKRTRPLFVALMTATFMAPLAFAERAPVLQQIKVPHDYYFREMYLPRVTTGPTSPAWSPDGGTLVFVMQGNLWRQALGSDMAVQLTAGAGYDFQPDWSPDGKRIVFTRYQDDAMELTVLDVDSGQVTPLTRGDAVNLDGPGSDLVRRFIIDNALHWIREYRLDGLRLDATHALIDDSPKPLVAELAERARVAVPWPLTIHAEDHRNLVTLIEPSARGGWDLDGVWADDFHHVVRRLLAGDAHGYYADFEGTTEELARTVRQGWLFTGQATPRTGRGRGTDVSTVPMLRFVVCIQNHDQIGNRARGDRLHHAVDLAAWRAASTLLLMAPMTPLLFMGQEWAASTPFQYFTDVEPDLGRLVTEGRRREFSAFPEFAAPEARERIPDPQSSDTFDRCRLQWDERREGSHAPTLALYRELLRLRRSHGALGASDATSGEAAAASRGAVVVHRADGSERFGILVQLSGHGTAAAIDPVDDGAGPPVVVLSTEDARFAPEPVPPQIERQPGRVVASFARPGAIIVRFA